MSNTSKDISLVSSLGKYGPLPTPVIVTEREAEGAEPAIAWFKRAPLYDLDNAPEYYTERPFGEENGEAVDITPLIDLGTISQHSEGHGTSMQVGMSMEGRDLQFLLNHIITNDVPSINQWILAYSLKYPSNITTQQSHKFEDRKSGPKHNWNTQYGLKYIEHIVHDNVEYPDQLKQLIIHIVDLSALNAQINIASQVNDVLYIPRNMRNRSFEYFLSSVYWLRKFRPERINIPKMNLIDLYFVTANPYERYAARKLLSYYDDEELYSNFGRIGNYLFPKEYRSKREQLDAFVSFSLFRFGYFTIETMSKPIQVTYHSLQNPIPTLDQIKSYPFLLTDLMKLVQVTDNQIYWIPPYSNESLSVMPILRLAIQVLSTLSKSQVDQQDVETWGPFLSWVNKMSDKINVEYLYLKKYPFQLAEERNIKTKAIVPLPINFSSLEQHYDLCLICLKHRPQRSEDHESDQGWFGLCGHGICSACQALLGSIKCPFCSEHFVFDNIGDDFVENLQDMRSRFKDRIIQLTNIKRNRQFKFDWANSDIALYH